MTDKREIIYAGIGSRHTPASVLDKMRAAARAMGKMGFKLRSGGAAGADEAFETGCISVDGLKEIFLPWKGFRQNSSGFYGSTLEARRIAREFHPNWAGLGCRGRDFHARNVYQILGPSLDRPADFVLCWTPEGKVVGGTGQALRMAAHFQIPIVNFGNQSDDDISDFILEVESRK